MLETYLFENRQQYRQMLQGLVESEYSTEQEINSLIDTARTVLRRNDRIVWYLKWWRLSKIYYTVKILSHWQTDDITPEILKTYDKYLKSLGLSPDDARTDRAVGYFDGAFVEGGALSHWGDSISRIPDVNAIVWGNQNPEELETELRTAEEEYTKNFSNSVDMTDYDAPWEKIIDYGDTAWVLLDKGACSKEGEAMGHCGNVPSVKEGDRILSYRTIRDGDIHQPHLTFILHADGSLGEMKGRTNNKPTQKYHKVIVDLLLNPIVKSIQGGGYAPHNNFEMKDLDIDVAKSIYQKKPSLMTLVDAYKLNMITFEMAKEIENQLELYGLDLGNGGIHFNNDDYSISLGTLDDMSDIAKYAGEIGSLTLEDMAATIADGTVDTLFDYDDRVDKRTRQFIYDFLGSEQTYYKAITVFVRSHYDIDFGDDEDVYSDVDDVIQTEPDVDNIRELFSNAVRHGYYDGTEQVMTEGIYDKLDENPTLVKENGVYDIRLKGHDLEEVLSTITKFRYDPDSGRMIDWIRSDIITDILVISDSEWDNEWNNLKPTFDHDAATEHLKELLKELPGFKDALRIVGGVTESLDRMKKLAGI